MKKDIKSFTLEELKKEMEAIGEKPYRAKQIYDWIHGRFADSFDEMTNLSKALKEKLKQEYTLTVLKPVQVLTSQLDGTMKVLYELEDGNVIESVLLRYQHGNSVCISTQVGCRMGCRFCASTLGGLTRNLTPSEMLEQIYRLEVMTGERVSHTVLMGSGEPLDNLDHVLRFITLLTDENGRHMSQRNITLSTCGLVPKMIELADRKLQITVALSLHASTQETREKLLPVSKAYKLPEVMDACRYYFEKTGRRITFEYSLVAGVNDTQKEAVKLAELVKGMNCHVNLIPVNPIKERDFRQPKADNVLKYKNMLEKTGINVTIRREMGRDIQGACGQLRKSYLEKKAPV